MLILLPILCFALLCWNFLRPLGVRIAIQEAFLTLVLFVALVTESLSFATQLTEMNVIVAWTTFLIVLAIVASLRYKQLERSLSIARDRAQSFIALIGTYPLSLKSGFALFCVLAITGVLVAPNNWDSMTYHLPRLFHWLDNASVGVYETSNVRQIQMPPLGEYGMLHLWVLTGREEVFNLHQTIALAVAVAVGTRLAASLASDISGQILSGWLTMCSWPVLLQATTPKNDIVVGLFFIIAVFSAFQLIFEDTAIRPALCFGLSVGLALLTKGTAYLLVAPLLAIVVVALSWKRQMRGLKWAIGSTLFFSILINGSFWHRNWVAFGSPLVGSADYTNARIGPETTLVNMTRLVGSSLASWSGTWNSRVSEAVHGVANAMGLKGGEGTVYGNGDFAVSARVTNEDYAPFHLHVSLFVGAMAMQVVSGWRNNHRQFLLLMIVVFSCVSFCTVSRWQIWITRLVIPVVMLSGVWLGTSISNALKANRAKLLGSELIVGMIIFYCLPVLLGNELKRFVGYPNNVFDTSRDSSLFNSNPMLAEKQLIVCDELQKLSQHQQRLVELGFFGNEDSYEYPLWTRGKSRVHCFVGKFDLDRFKHLDAIYIDRIALDTADLQAMNANEAWSRSTSAMGLWTRK